MYEAAKETYYWWNNTWTPASLLNNPTGIAKASASNCTSASWQAYQEALNTANAELEKLFDSDGNATAYNQSGGETETEAEKAVSAALAGLQTAVNGLDHLADSSDLLNAQYAYKQLTVLTRRIFNSSALNESTYTEDSWSAFLTAATAANDIADEVQEKLDHGDFVGEQGPEGRAATVQIGTVQTGQAGSAAQVTNTGTTTDAVFNFVIPQGATGTVDNLETVAVNFNIDSTYQNIASGMTVTQLFARIQLLLDNLFMSATEVSNLADTLGISTSRLYAILTETVGKITQTPTKFSGTRNSGFSAGSCTGVYDHVTGIVRLTFGFTSTSNVATGTTLFTIPEEYRPASQATGTALFGVYTSSGMTTGAATCTLNENGTITQSLTSNARSGFGYIEYYLG